ncbi:phenylacetic acid degradation protein [Variovorax sp. WS11]|uniref:PaaI family thioesterase n=1 Tax=Variovorax sp. WS11 TaxID=1105204 RepID=UPI000D0E2724|nr:PaaI family thioesterase [Variovorax sp. WS11]NDZ13195.1 PaaI family thioesterase [Variovorax sp. WS11]PSL81543.1 phenylacetic acid degradation protein [Variovorax sp. WS11]
MTSSQAQPDANAFEGEAPGLLFGLAMPMARAMALRGEAIGHDRARIRMHYQAEQTNSRGDVHGGAIASLLDCTLAAAVRSHDPAGFGVVTIDLTLHFVSAGGGDLVANAHCDRRGRSISFARGEVHTEDGTLVAMATGTFTLLARAAAAPASNATGA